MYKPQREMKKLEKFNSRLFEGLKDSALSNLGRIIGGGEKASCVENTGECDVIHTDDKGNAESRYVDASNTDEYSKITKCNSKTGQDELATGRNLSDVVYVNEKIDLSKIWLS